MAGNKSDNGVHEVGTDDILASYKADTPGELETKYLENVNEYIKKGKEKQKQQVKAAFSMIFDNPLQGYPYNEQYGMDKTLEEDSDKRPGDPCWKGYKQVGMKKKNGKEVPNCVPMSEEELKEAGIDKSEEDYAHLEEKNMSSGDMIKKLFKLKKDNEVAGVANLMNMTDVKVLQKMQKDNPKGFARLAAHMGKLPAMEEAELDEGFASPSKIKLEKETVQKYFPKIKNPKVIDHLTKFVQIATKNHGQMLATLQDMYKTNPKKFEALMGGK